MKQTKPTGKGPSQAGSWTSQCCSHSTTFVDKKDAKLRKSLILFPQCQRATEAKQCVPMLETLKGHCVKLVKVKPRLCFRPQDVGDVKTAKGMYQGELNTGNGSSSGEILLTTKLEVPRHLTKPSEPEVPATRHRATNLCICPAGFQSWFSLIFPYYVPKLPFLEG